MKLKELFRSFKYRFYDSASVADFMISAKRITAEYGSLNSLFIHSLSKADNNFPEALSYFAEIINMNSSARFRLLPDPAKGSACKRLNLFFEMDGT